MAISVGAVKMTDESVSDNEQQKTRRKKEKKTLNFTLGCPVFLGAIISIAGWFTLIHSSSVRSVCGCSFLYVFI